MNIFSFDAETDGLYGKPWAIGAVVLDDQGRLLDRFAGQIDPELAVNDPWVRENIVPVVDLPRMPTREKLLNDFWWFWIQYREQSVCVADFGAAVEANLFRLCIQLNHAERQWQGPYPMHELGTRLLDAGLDPDLNRREFADHPGLVQHDPVDDALGAGLCWLKAGKLLASHA